MNPFFIMAFQLDLDYAADLAPHEFERFASLIDPTWIDEALRQTNTVSLRRRRLPAERMVWLVIGLALFRNEPIWHIVQQLDLADGPALTSPAPSAAVAGRERLGEAPLAWLFGRLATLHATLGDRTWIQGDQAGHVEKSPDPAQQAAGTRTSGSMGDAHRLQLAPTRNRPNGR